MTETHTSSNGYAKLLADCRRRTREGPESVGCPSDCIWHASLPEMDDVNLHPQTSSCGLQLRAQFLDLCGWLPAALTPTSSCQLTEKLLTDSPSEHRPRAHSHHDQELCRRYVVFRTPSVFPQQDAGDEERPGWLGKSRHTPSASLIDRLGIGPVRTYAQSQHAISRVPRISAPLTGIALVVTTKTSLLA